jgi:formate C-acetyltransferase
LREDVYSKAGIVKDWINVSLGLGKIGFRRGIRMDMDRVRLMTQAFRETEGLPRVLQHTTAVERLCDEMPLFIKPGELIVGDPNGAPDKVRWFPEVSMDWIPDSVTTGGFSEMVTDEEQREIVEDLCPYWEDKCVAGLVTQSLPEDMKPMIVNYGSLVCDNWKQGRFIPAYDWDLLFRQGLKARIEAAEANLRDLDARVLEMDPGEYLSKKHNWEAQARCGGAILRYAQRLAAVATDQAKEEKDGTRRSELEEIAEILNRVPAHPPRTFHECLQFYWTIEVVAHYMVKWGTGAGTRIDQVWWPYCEADLRAGRIDRAKALELVECLFLKIQEVGAPLEWPPAFTAVSAGGNFYTADIAGSTPDGSDASNELTFIIMEALANLRTYQPPIALRYHRNISPDVIDKALDLGRLGLGHPSYFNEELLEQWALMRGWSKDDAKRSQAAACIVNNVMGKTIGSNGLIEVGAIDLSRVLTEVLDSTEPLNSGPLHLDRPKDPRQVASAEELLESVMDRVRFYLQVSMVSWNIAQQILTEQRMDPCNSFLMDECLKRGIDLHRLHKEYDTCPYVLPLGMVNASDSLAAIQRLVFDEKKYTMEELLTSLKSNWADREEMRQDFLKAPKYGNDDDYADEWALKLRTRFQDTMAEVKDAWGHSVTVDASTAATYVQIGMVGGATADGRRAMSPLADGTRSPMTGADAQGPTAVLNSAGKIPFMHTELMNQRIMPQFMEGDNRQLVAEYLREWFEKGTIPHLQFNVIGNDILREAQREPEKHQDLIVRVAGYSAYFVDLPEITQNTILDRTEQSFVS